MIDHEPFLRKIAESPADDGPRLVYCDYLEEQGDVERAEFIRLQIGKRHNASAGTGYVKEFGEAWVPLPESMLYLWQATWARGFPWSIEFTDTVVRHKKHREPMRRFLKLTPIVRAVVQHQASGGFIDRLTLDIGKSDGIWSGWQTFRNQRNVALSCETRDNLVDRFLDETIPKAFHHPRRRKPRQT